MEVESPALSKQSFFMFRAQSSPYGVSEIITKSQPTHVTTGNSDGRQQTLADLATIYHTNASIYVPKTQSLRSLLH